MVGRIRHRQRVRPLSLQAFLGPDLLPGSGLPTNHERAQVQLQFTINPPYGECSIHLSASGYTRLWFQLI
jgi:hypothetical protein